MQRTWLVALVAALVAAALGVGITFAVLVDTNKGPFATSSPSATPLETEEATTPEPTATTEPTEATARPTAKPSSPTPAAVSTTPKTRKASDISCAKEPVYCSDESASMVVRNDRLQSTSSNVRSTNRSNAPEIEMKWKILDTEGNQAAKGDRVEGIHVDVLIRNDTNRTFVFPRREIALVVTRDGRAFDTLRTRGSRFEMPPGASMHAAYDETLTLDGTYTWRAKTWFYAKS